jgi:uncharacterized protein YuzE
MKNLETIKEYINHKILVRNQFYSVNNMKAAEMVQKDIEKLIKQEKKIIGIEIGAATLKTNDMKNLEQLLKETEMLEFANNDDVAFIWKSTRSQKFVLEFNTEVIKAVKTLKPIELFLETKKMELV